MYYVATDDLPQVEGTGRQLQPYRPSENFSGTFRNCILWLEENNPEGWRKCWVNLSEAYHQAIRRLVEQREGASVSSSAGFNGAARGATNPSLGSDTN
eukprot:Trichotokara_eunicae@DN4515_c0_g1_i1.p2